MPPGEVKVDDNKITPPARKEMKVRVDENHLWAMSTFSPVGSLSSNGLMCVCVDGMNLKYVLGCHFHIYQFIPYYACVYTQTRASSNHLRTAN